MEIIALILFLSSMVSVIIISYGKQQEKHRRHKEWMRKNKGE